MRIAPLVLSVFCCLSVTSRPAFAQPPADAGKNVLTLEIEVANLLARVAALESQVGILSGHITAADLAGSYSVSEFQTELTGLPQSPSVGSAVGSGTLTLAADGSGSFSGTDQGFSATASGVIGHSFPSSGSGCCWSYNNGIVTIPGINTPLSVAVGGRVLIATSAQPGSTPTSGIVTLLILTRLQ